MCNSNSAHQKLQSCHSQRIGEMLPMSFYRVLWALCLLISVRTPTIVGYTYNNAPAESDMSPLERGEHPPDSLLVLQLKQPLCRENCIEKFNAIDDSKCLQTVECSACQDRCAAIENNIIRSADNIRPTLTAMAHHRLQLLPMNSLRPPPHLPQLPPTPSMPLPLPAPPVTVRLQTVALVRDRSLVSADIRWRWPQQAQIISNIVATAHATQADMLATSSSSAWHRSGGHCLVTWDVLGGGLMGNLLTDVPEVQLSLWPQTVYHIQVTCKCKEDGSMFKSLPLTIDTSDAVVLGVSPSTTVSSNLASISIPWQSSLRSTSTSSQPDQRSQSISANSLRSYRKEAKKPKETQLDNEIVLPRQLSSLQQDPLHRFATEPLRTHRITHGLMLVICLAGAVMIGAWFWLLRQRCGSQKTASRMSISKQVQDRKSRDKHQELTLWIDSGQLDVATVDNRTAPMRSTAHTDIPLMRVIHV